MRLSLSAMAILFVLANQAQGHGAEPASKDASLSKRSQSPDEAPVNSSQFYARMLEIAREYETYGRVDDEYRWAPTLCRMPQPSVARFSASDDAGSHGQKLYFLFAKDRDGYLLLGAPPAETTPVGKEEKPGERLAAVGQVIVKESWLPKEVEKSQQQLTERRPIQAPAGFKGLGKYEAIRPYAEREGKLYHASEKGALFIMFKLDPATAEADQGWVYGTLTADFKKITSAGKVASCMACHREASRDRLFGLEMSDGARRRAIRSENPPTTTPVKPSR